MQWRLLLDLNACWRMRLPLVLKAIMMYWFPEHALTGRQPVLFVYSLLRGYTMIKTSLDGTSAELGAVIDSAGGDKGVGSLGLVNIIFWRCWARCPRIVLLALGQYLATLEYVRPSKVSQFSQPRLLDREAKTAMVEAHKGADAREVKGLRVDGGAECLGCHGHSVDHLIQEHDGDVLPSSAGSLDALARVRLER
jgi:hypothetical protein